jgi:ribosomal protein S10
MSELQITCQSLHPAPLARVPGALAPLARVLRLPLLGTGRPRRRSRVAVLRSPHKHKRSQEHYQRQTWTTLHRLPLPPGPRGDRLGSLLVQLLRRAQWVGVETRLRLRVPEAYPGRGSLFGLSLNNTGRVWGPLGSVGEGWER